MNFLRYEVNELRWISWAAIPGGRHPKSLLPIKYPVLRIVHNHGYMDLKDAVITHGIARGIIMGGGEASRLFQATSHKWYIIGKPGSWPVWNEPHRSGEIWEVSCQFCG